MNCPFCDDEMEEIERENGAEYECSDCGISEVVGEIGTTDNKKLYRR
jgi:hypothetical protein